MSSDNTLKEDPTISLIYPMPQAAPQDLTKDLSRSSKDSSEEGATALPIYHTPEEASQDLHSSPQQSGVIAASPTKAGSVDGHKSLPVQSRFRNSLYRGIDYRLVEVHHSCDIKKCARC